MSTRDPDIRDERLSQLLNFHSLSWTKANLHTSIPGIVQEYTAATKRAKVQIALRLLMTDGETMPRPVILNVPVVHPSGGGWIIHLPLQADDAVLLVFSERGIQAFKETFGISDPPRHAFFQERDAVAIPGFGALSITPVSTTGLVAQNEEGTIYLQMEPDGTVNVTTPGAVTVDAGGNATVNSGGSITLAASSETLVIP